MDYQNKKFKTLKKDPSRVLCYLFQGIAHATP